jgi:hypothetical protein
MDGAHVRGGERVGQDSQSDAAFGIAPERLRALLGL